MDKAEAIEIIRQNKAAAELYAQLSVDSESVANELKDIETLNMAIEALTAEAVCDDCIWHVCNYNKVDWDAPPADAVQGWTSVSERLPERGEIVLVSYKTTDKVHMCKYLDDGTENQWWSYNDDCFAWDNVVLAWMSLPKSYRKDGE